MTNEMEHLSTDRQKSVLYIEQKKKEKNIPHFPCQEDVSCWGDGIIVVRSEVTGEKEEDEFACKVIFVVGNIVGLSVED